MPKKNEISTSDKWNLLEDEYHILDGIKQDGVFYISADQMLELGRKTTYKFEPRLLSHYDNSQSQPDLFKKNAISILPVTRGQYVLGHFNPFMRIKDYEDFPIKTVAPAPDWQESTKTSLRFNESMGIAYAEQVGIISDFTGENELVASVAGRHSGNSWFYKIRSDQTYLKLEVANPQIEVDGGYEGRHSLVLLEAKNKAVGEFCLRQLYFPYRTWRNYIHKTVRTVFMSISGDDFYLLEYEFPDPEMFEGHLVNKMHYIVQGNLISRREFKELIHITAVKPSLLDESLFPQANSPTKTFNIIDYLSKEPRTKNDIAGYIGFDPRQSDYYGNSGAYFGFIERGINQGIWKVTKDGLAFSQAKERDRKLIFMKALLQRPVFREVLQSWFENNEIPDESFVIACMQHQKIPLNSMTTRRRASTVRNWIRWVANNIG